MKLFLSGVKGGGGLKKLSPTLVKVKKILDESEDGELFTSAQITELVNVSYCYIRQQAYRLPGYCHKAKVALIYWGKPKTIEQLKKELKKK